jgi:hypothetical protein
LVFLSRRAYILRDQNGYKNKFKIFPKVVIPFQALKTIYKDRYTILVVWPNGFFLIFSWKNMQDSLYNEISGSQPFSR